MTRRIYEFVCPDGHVTEKFIDEEVRETDCSACDATATKMISAVQCSLDPISGDWPGATMKWAKNRQDQIKRERSRENS
jgi:hypothetical protein